MQAIQKQQRWWHVHFLFATFYFFLNYAWVFFKIQSPDVLDIHSFLTSPNLSKKTTKRNKLTGDGVCDQCQDERGDK
jgi:hypothetical protein